MGLAVSACVVNNNSPLPPRKQIFRKSDEGDEREISKINDIGIED